MRYTLIIAVCLTLCVSTAAAQSGAGSIAIFSDQAGTSCDFIDAGSLVTVYVFHVNHTGAMYSQFKLDISNTSWIHLGDSGFCLDICGISVDGVFVHYGECRTAPTYLGLAHFFGSSEPACTTIGIVPDPAAPSGQIEAVDCSDPPVKVYPTGGVGVVNPDGTCPCNPPIPVEQSTWGAVKALYH